MAISPHPNNYPTEEYDQLLLECTDCFGKYLPPVKYRGRGGRSRGTRARLTAIQLLGIDDDHIASLENLSAPWRNQEPALAGMPEGWDRSSFWEPPVFEGFGINVDALDEAWESPFDAVLDAVADEQKARLKAEAKARAKARPRRRH